MMRGPTILLHAKTGPLSHPTFYSMSERTRVGGLISLVWAKSWNLEPGGSASAKSARALQAPAPVMVHWVVCTFGCQRSVLGCCSLCLLGSVTTSEYELGIITRISDYIMKVEESANNLIVLVGSLFVPTKFPVHAWATWHCTLAHTHHPSYSHNDNP